MKNLQRPSQISNMLELLHKLRRVPKFQERRRVLVMSTLFSNKPEHRKNKYSIASAPTNEQSRVRKVRVQATKYAAIKRCLELNTTKVADEECCTGIAEVLPPDHLPRCI